MENFNWGFATSIEVKIHNGQGLGGYPIPMGSEWLTSIPIHIRDVVQLGRTLALGARGRWFKSSHLDKKNEKKIKKSLTLSIKPPYIIV